MLPFIVSAALLIGIVTLLVLQDLPYWRYSKELKSRESLSALELQEKHLPDVPVPVVEVLVRIVEEQFGEDPRLIRPNDNHCLIHDDLDSSEFINAIETAFDFKFTEDEMENLDGSFGSIARHCAKHGKIV